MHTTAMQPATTPSAQAAVDVDVTRQNFKEQLPAIREALNECSFFAVDLEMTGLFTDNCKEEFLDDMQDRYTKLRESAGAYVITQFGLSCFTPSRDGQTWTAKTFNAYVFPEPPSSELPGPPMPTRRFLSDAGSMSFLASQGFDFNKWVHQGVPYIALNTYEERLARVNQWKGEARPDAQITAEADKEWIRGILDQVREWVAGDEPSLLLPKASAWQRLLCWQEVVKPQHYPGLVPPTPQPAPEDATAMETETGAEAAPACKPEKPHVGFYIAKEYNNGWTYLRLVRATREEAAAYEAAEAERRAALLQDAAGFSEVLRAIRDSGKPAVGHNCWFDLAYILASFATGPYALPHLWSDYKQLVGAWFRGGVYDTKHLARAVLPDLFPDTMLSSVFGALTQDGPALQRARAMVGDLSGHLGVKVCVPSVHHAPGFTKYAGVEAGGAAHEAGYDAFMTGSVFAALAPLTHAATVRAENAGCAAGAAAPAAASDIVRAAAGAAVAGGPAEAGEKVDTPAPAAAPAAAADMDVDMGAGESQPAPPSPSLGGGDWDEVAHHNPLDFVQRFVGRLNMTRSDMEYAALSGPDPSLTREHVMHVWLEGPPGTVQAAPHVMEVVRRLQAAGALGRPRVTNLPPAGPMSVGGVLVEMEGTEGPTAEQLQAALQQQAMAEAGYGSPDAPGPASGEGAGTAPATDAATAYSGPVWRVQTFVEYANAKKALLAAYNGSMGRGWDRGGRGGAGGGFNGGGRPIKRLRVEGTQGLMGEIVAGPGAAEAAAAAEAGAGEEGIGEPRSRVKTSLARKCCIM